MSVKCPACGIFNTDTAERCDCGQILKAGATTSPGATAQTRSIPIDPAFAASSGIAPRKFFWVVSLIATVIGGAIGILGVVAANGAPQEAASAAIGCLVIIAGYAFARAVEALS